MYNLQNTLAKCKNELDKLGIKYGKSVEIKENNRFSQVWGRTRLNSNSGHYTIEIASTLLDERNPENALNQTVMHELLHTCKNCFKHTGEWKAYANLVNKVYGYDVERTNSFEDLGLVVDNRPAKYKYVCQKCGQTLVRQRECNFTRHPERYEHLGCGGRFSKVY